jgi:predicted DNA-binding transcriptional regulator
MNKDQVLGIIRHVLTAIGSILVVKGYTDELTTTTAIGAIITAVGAIWSIVDKKEENVLQKAEEIQQRLKNESEE